MKACLYCGTPLENRKKDTLYCDVNCRVGANRERKSANNDKEVAEFFLTKRGTKMRITESLLTDLLNQYKKNVTQSVTQNQYEGWQLELLSILDNNMPVKHEVHTLITEGGCLVLLKDDDNGGALSVLQQGSPNWITILKTVAKEYEEFNAEQAKPKIKTQSDYMEEKKELEPTDLEGWNKFQKIVNNDNMLSVKEKWVILNTI